jgi:hypothetical protein
MLVLREFFFQSEKLKNWLLLNPIFGESDNKEIALKTGYY